MSNFERIRIYVKTQIDYEEFNLFNLSKARFDLLYLFLSLKEQIAETDAKINEAVYKLYGLSADEIAAVEGACPKNRSHEKVLLCLLFPLAVD